MVSLVSTAKRAAKKTTRFPMDSSLTASQRLATKVG